MADSTDEFDVIEQKHKKEKKELQTKIQSLKKTVGKGDKKKKKEVLDEILRLETELERQHLEELNIFQNKCPETPSKTNDTPSTVESNAPRISKAQKRREKKAAEEKTRGEMILQQEIENINGPRNIEKQIIKKLLKDRKLIIYGIPSDGDCLYGAIAHQLSVIKDKCLTVEEVRKMTADHLRKNKNNFLPFLSDLDTGDMLDDIQYEKYCDKIATTKTWGGQVELQAISELLKCCIEVVQAESPSVIIQGAEYGAPSLIITFHRHMFGLGEHYNSTQKATESDLEASDECS